MSALPLPIAAFLAGLLSFLSPCVLPLVPGYVSLISGATVENLQSADRRMMRAVMLNSCLFIAGFSVVFISLGAVATTVGQLTREFHRELAMIAGAVIIIFGLHLTGLVKIKALYADKRLHSMKAAGPLRAFLVGFAFGTLALAGFLAGAIVSGQLLAVLRSPLAGRPALGPFWPASSFWPVLRTRLRRGYFCWRSIRWVWLSHFCLPRSG